MSALDNHVHADATLASPAKATLSGALLRDASVLAFKKLSLRIMWHNPVMFVVELGAILISALAVFELYEGSTQVSGGSNIPVSFSAIIAAWLWLTVYFASFSEALAEGRGKAQSQSLKNTRAATDARVVNSATRIVASFPLPTDLTFAAVPSAELNVGMIVDVSAGNVIPGDGEVIWGIASVDESAITGESAPVVREAGTDHSAVTGGTRVLSDRILVEITTEPGQTFVDKMINLVEGSSRQRTPNELALSILLASLSIIFLLVVVTLNPAASFDAQPASLSVLVALLVCLIPTTIGALLSAIGIAGMNRLVKANVLAKSGRAVEAAGDVSTLLLDKTGTITYGNRRAHSITPLSGTSFEELAQACVNASLADPTPEGKSVLDLLAQFEPDRVVTQESIVPFSAATRMSGVDLSAVSHDSVDLPAERIRKGATSSVVAWFESFGDSLPQTTRTELFAEVERISQLGGTPLVVARQRDQQSPQILGVIYLKDIVKEGLRERFEELRAMGIKTIMVTGDNALTAAAIAAEAGVDDYISEATPEDKFAYIKKEQAGGKLVAMTGDGTNDAPALAQADVGVAMNSGTSAAKEAGNMVDLDSDPTKLLEVIKIGKQLLITRGALTTFSIANDVAKYFAIVPAMFVGAYPGLSSLNIMRLSSPASAVLSAVIFNALIIIALIPIALRGVEYKPRKASRILTHNLLIYGLGGLVAPFIGVKLIDMMVALLPGF